MQPLHPLDAISPAFARARQTILTPFKLGRAWKLAACSYLAFAGSIFLPLPLVALLIPRAALPPLVSAGLLFAMLLVPFLLWFAIFYCGNRMAFVEFEMLVTRAKFVAPMWNRYGARTWPYMGLKMLWGTVVSLAFVPLFVAKVRALAAGFPEHMAALAPGTPGTPPNPEFAFAILGELMGLYALFFALFLTLKFLDTLLNDFVLPFYAIEELSLGAAIVRGWQVVRSDPWQVLLYLLLKFLLAIAGYICLMAATFVCEIPLLILVFLIAGLGALVLHLVPGAPGHLLVVTGGVVLYGALYLAFIALILGFTGYLFSVLEAYAIYFLGGRYPKLGDYLEPPSYTYAPPPLPPSPEEDEDDGGPSLPMDPALV